MSNNVRVIDNLSGSVLLETSIEKLSEAYDFAALMEKEGLDISVEAPGLAVTLYKALGADDSEIVELKQGLNDEIESHEDDLGCATCLPKV